MVVLFGNLSDFPLIECLGLIRDRCGKLVFTQLPGDRTAELYLEYANVRYAVFNGQKLQTQTELLEFIAKLSSSIVGEFEFIDVHPSEMLYGIFNQPIQVLLDFVQRRNLRTEVRENDLPHLETRFRNTTTVLPWMDDELFDFYERAQPFLTTGTNGNELSRMLGIPGETIQIYLSHLRTSDVIEIDRQLRSRDVIHPPSTTLPTQVTVTRPMQPQPMLQPSASAPVLPTAAQNHGLLSRLLGALQKRRFI